MTDRTDGFTTEYDVRAVRDPDFTDPNNPDAIRADIRQTRERMSHTVENIGERLNPDRLKAQLKSNIHDATIGKAEHMARVAYDRVEETRHGLMDNIRENPVPAAMVGIGLGWLLLNGRKNHDERVVRHVEYDRFSGPTYDRYAGSDARYYTPIYDDGHSSGGFSGRAEAATDRVSEMGDAARERAEELTHKAHDRVSGLADNARDTVHNVADKAQDRVSDLAENARDTVHQVRDRAREFAADTRYRTHRVEDRFDEALNETPLAIGAAAVALGLAIGLSAPSTRRESELMGARRDELVNRAREAAEGVTERVQDVATRVVDQAQETVREAAKNTSTSASASSSTSGLSGTGTSGLSGSGTSGLSGTGTVGTSGTGSAGTSGSSTSQFI